MIEIHPESSRATIIVSTAELVSGDVILPYTKIRDKSVELGGVDVIFGFPAPSTVLTITPIANTHPKYYDLLLRDERSRVFQWRLRRRRYKSPIRGDARFAIQPSWNDDEAALSVLCGKRVILDK